MSALIEPLILYFVLFLSASVYPAPPPDLIPFSLSAELTRTFFYNIPSLALIWYILLRTKSFRAWGAGISGLRDLPSLALTFPGMILIGVTISAVSSFFPGIPEGPRVESPENIPGWLVLALSCLSTGYLEESFFRFYLHRKLEDHGISQGKTVLVSALLFSICHIYEGPWGCLNAVLAGFLLSFIFMRFRSLHGIAFAHGLYNIFVYAAGTIG
ncbi:MAG: CPBP family intramembrane metalloprotease [Treponema sp.]|jgi:membrane protease YdiL (CAAX protease family)|nr:CPBP family intramembrane metalloprotease [Treponema sp.]